MSENLAIFPVLFPLLAAPLAALLQWKRAAWAVATFASAGTFASVVALLLEVLERGPVSYALGDWAAPYGIEYRVDTVGAYVLLVVSSVAVVVMPYAARSVAREVGHQREPHLYSSLLLCLAGLLGITITGDVFNLFVFLEISSISAYALIAMGVDRRALHASYKYLIMGSIGATFVVIGIGMMYVMTGTLNIADLAQRLPTVGGRTLSVAFAFLTVGISLKLALFPMHLWLPDAYTYAPSTVTAFLASTATKVAVYMLIRFFFTVFGLSFSFEVMSLHRVLLPLALLAIFVASVRAIYQDNVKRLLAYSSVAQIGYMTLGISLGSATGLAAGLLHLFNHALMKAALFMSMGAVVFRIGSVRLDRMRGLGKRMPWTMAAFVAGGLSLVGVPLTVGFVSKWFLVLSAFENGGWTLAFLVVLGSLLALIYVWKVVEVAYFQGCEGSGEVREAPLSLLLPMWAMVLASLYFGVDSRLTAGIALQAARHLLSGVAP